MKFLTDVFVVVCVFASIRFIIDGRMDYAIYLDKMTQAITDELFTNKQSELKVGEMCEVGNGPDRPWYKRKLIAILPDNYYSNFIAQADNDENDWSSYRYARPICKRIEPKVEVNGEIRTYTWEEE